FTYTRLALGVDHEYRRDVLLHGLLSVQHAEFIDTLGQQTQYLASAGVTWLASRWVHVTATAAVSRQTGTPSQSLPSNYTRVVGLVTVRLAM
ncbi:MAG: outer membrane beta-barrel protein, partial [Acetobacteraceae bacterium]|nr:outer membrane beta-barrel protein [Acetobacteraceae bacterium]